MNRTARTLHRALPHPRLVAAALSLPLVGALLCAALWLPATARAADAASAVQSATSATARGVETAASATARGVEVAGSAAAHGVAVGEKAVVKGLKAAASGVELGARKTGEAITGVARRLGIPTEAASGNTSESSR